MYFNIKEVWQILNSKEKRQIALVTIIQAVSGLFDMIGIISVVPFLTLSVNPEMVTENKYLFAFQNYTNLNHEEMLLTFGIFSFVIILANQCLRTGAMWYSSFVGQEIWLNLHDRMFKYYLSQDYNYFFKNNSFSMLEKLTIQVNTAQSGVIQPLYTIMGHFFTTFFIVGTLIYFYPLPGLSAVLLLIAFYFLFYKNFKKKLESLGKTEPETYSKLYNLFGDTFGSIKEIKVLHNENHYQKLFYPLGQRHCNAQVKKTLIEYLPYGITEVVAYGGIILLTLVLLSTLSNITEIITVLVVFAFSLKRILPAVHGIYNKVARMKFHQASFDAVKEELKDAYLDANNLNKQTLNENKITFKESIELNNLNFRYESAKKNTLSSVSLKIKKGNFIGITGSTGSGKSTLVDIILGLLKPNDGTFLVDGKTLDKTNLTSWHNNIGYVDQVGFLSDSSISENIAFGVSKEKFDFSKIKKAAEFARISDFIEKELPNKYDTFVGERGVRLSGGQRQRIRIARAIYKDPQVLILDEATNSLDVITEEAIINSLKNLSLDFTVIMVSHRVPTLMNCDNILFLENGKLVDQGNYSDLLKNNMNFNKLLKEQKNNFSEKNVK